MECIAITMIQKLLWILAAVARKATHLAMCGTVVFNKYLLLIFYMF